LTSIIVDVSLFEETMVFVAEYGVALKVAGYVSGYFDAVCSDAMK
jgi:hypothetical protein